MKRRICVVTSSRAEYGHMYWLMKEIQADPDLILQLVVAGAHLSKKFGLTYQDIEKDGFKIDKRLKTLLYSDSEVGISKSIGRGCAAFADAFHEIKPDIIVILGDRYEMLAAAIAAYIAKKPIAHLHGGELTGGLIDEGIRHSITKMASLHFAGTDEYRQRIIQMGEDPKFVFNFGSPGLDSTHKLTFLNKEKLAEFLHFDLSGKVGLVTFHPVTLERNTSQQQVLNLLHVIDKFDFKAVFTTTNADTYGRVINIEIQKHCRKHPQKYIFVYNLGQLKYFSCLKNFDLMIGNSSSGLIEAPSFSMPVVNIGDRQKGRMKAKNIIDVEPTQEAISEGIKKALSEGFKKSIRATINPYDKYGDGKNSIRIKEKLKRIKLTEELTKKNFYDLNFKLKN
jgi:UDP-N-acetylglucosamine 2-epimerase (non-hydrolysing)/GDP/UDP-N,N'-diacetylbacillosamine 2-epimerase (hydrolysing)